jgi:predicted RNA-binding protein
MKSSNYYIFILNPKEWDFVKTNQIIGTQRKEIYEKINQNDKILIYVTEKSEINALFEVEYKIKSNDLKYENDYSYLLKISLIKYFDKKPDFKKIIDKLDFIKNKKNWFSHLAGSKGIRELSLKDYTAIIKFLQ